jgi:hypothetical protein
MKENTSTTYTCDICNHSWSVKEFAEKCEAIGYPKNYDKLLGKWIIVPATVYFSEEKAENSFDFTPRKEWRAVRIDSNYITNLMPDWPVTTGNTFTEESAKEFDKEHGEKLLTLHHRLVVNCKGFEDNSRVDSLQKFFNVPESMFEHLNSLLVEMELERARDKKEAEATFGSDMTRYVARFFTSHTFEKYQHDMAENVLTEVLETAHSEIGPLPPIQQDAPASITMQAN